jgi:hypothetical protein
MLIVKTVKANERGSHRHRITATTRAARKTIRHASVEQLSVSVATAIAIRMPRRKRGPGAASSHAGLPSSSGRGKR